MRLTLDLDLIAERLLPGEAERLRELAALSRKPVPVWLNLILVFGALATAAGVVALNPAPEVGLILAAISLAGALFVRHGAGPAWRVLECGLAIMAAAGLSGFVATTGLFARDSHLAPVIIFALTTGLALLFRERFLAAMSVVALGGVVGMGTGYWHASYGLFVQEPTLTILTFGALAAGLYALRGRLSGDWASLATIAARVSVMFANFGFWVGSLWGDRIGEHWVAQREDWEAFSDWRETAINVPDLAFTLGWVGALALMIWRGGRGGFLATSAIVFFAIHAYTQFFERLHYAPEALILGGISAVALATWLGVSRMHRLRAA